MEASRSSSIIGSRAPTPNHHWPVSALVRRCRARAGQGTAQADRSGRRPRRPKRERREAPTVQDLIDRYIAEHLPKKSAGSGHDDEKTMLGEIGKHSEAHQGRRHSRRRHGEMHRKISESIGRGGNPRRVRANRILTVCSKMFTSAGAVAGETLPWRNAVLGNPCKGIERNHEEGRERFSAGRIGAISDALNKYPGVAADCVRLVMLTGCRPAEAMRAEWTEFEPSPAIGSSRPRTPSSARRTRCR